MSNLDKLIEWIVTEIDMLTYEQLNKSNTSAKIKWLQIGLNQCLEKALQLQKEEPKTYTQEEINIVTWENQVAIMKALRYLMPVQSDVNNKLKERIISTEEEIILHTPKTKQ